MGIDSSNNNTNYYNQILLNHQKNEMMPLAAIWMNLESGMGFPGGSVVKNLPVMQELQEMWV